MSNTITEILLSDRQSNQQVDALLQQEGIRRDGNLDYTCGIFDDDWNLVATGSCFHNTIRCLAVSSNHQGEGLLNQVLSHLVDVQMTRGNSHLFLYTKPESAKFMADLGFHEITRVPGVLVFMENRRGGFTRYCGSLLAKQPTGQRIAGIVMNANPFTLGHLHLVEQAARENDVVHLFILSEESGPIPFAVRKMLVEQGVCHLKNVICHASGPYLISAATFPSYFLKDSDTAIRTQAELDLLVFGKLAEILGIQRRYVGQEHSSHVTALYNEVMGVAYPADGITALRSCMRGLMTAGYIQIRRERDDRGRYGQTHLIIYERSRIPYIENPNLENPRMENPRTESPNVEIPRMGYPTVENP